MGLPLDVHRAGDTATPATESSLAGAVVLFPGQGSQAPAMGAAWRHTPAWELVEQAETALGRRLAPFLTDPHRAPTTTTDIQLAVLLTSLLGWRALTAAGEGAAAPAAFAGHSLGQITALAAAGVLTVTDAVRVVAARGAITERACRTLHGGMVAVLGTDRAIVERACAAAGAWVANDNAPGQLVISGDDTALAAATDRVARHGGRKLIRLDVPGPFHCPLMARAAREFADHLSGTTFAAPSRPVVRNADARPAPPGLDWATELATHLTTPVRWRDTQHHLVARGATAFLEVGHGTTLTSIARRTVTGPRLVNVDHPAAARTAATHLHPGVPAAPHP